MRSLQTIVLLQILGFLSSGALAKDQLDASTPAKPIFSSHYTDIKTECSYERGAEMLGIKDDVTGDIPYTCPPFKGYQAAIHWSALNGSLQIRRLAPHNVKYATPWTAIALDRGTALIGRKLEWRLANGQPFAVIVRYTEWDTQDIEPKNLGERLAVKGLTGFESINAIIDTAKDPRANETARKRADDGYKTIQSGARLEN